MNQLTIQTHDFNNAKKQLKQYSEKVPKSVELQTVSTEGGLFNWFEHKVTGNELNQLTTQIQKHLIAINNLQIESIKEFGQVYKALEALDNDYIKAIILSIQAAEKASDQAKKSAEKAEKNSEDIANTIKVQAQTISVLKQFKEKIDQFEQLKHIDELWSDSQTFKTDIQSINLGIQNIVESIKKQAQGIAVLRQFKEQIDQYEQLKYIDEIWSDSQTFKKDIQSINLGVENIVESIEEQAQVITVLKKFKEQIDQYEQLKHIDEIWNDSQTFKKDIQSINLGVENIVESIEEQTQAITVLEQFKEQIDQYKRLKHIDEIWSDSQTFKKDIQSINLGVENIVESIEKQAQAITVLEQFKEQIDQYEQLKNIDEIWSDSQTFKKDIQSINLGVENIVESIEEQAQAITILKQFKEQIDQYEQLKNIDEIWSDSQTFKKDIQSINLGVENIVESIEEQAQAITILKQFKEQIDQYEQLKNIDEIWSDSQTFKKDIQSINIKIENQKEEIDREIKEQMNYMRSLLNENKMNYEAQNKILFKKLKVAYILAGSSIGVTLINFVLHVLGIV
jgi:cytochrome c556